MVISGMEYRKLLKRSGICRAELARHLGLSESGVYRWNDSPPLYAHNYLVQYCERREAELQLVDLRKFITAHDKSHRILERLRDE